METGLPLLDLLRVIFLFRRADANEGNSACSHSFPTPYGVEKAIENYLHRTGGAAPP